MADRSCNSPTESTLDASHTENEGSDFNKSNPISSSCASRINVEVCYGEGENVSCKNQSSNSNVDISSETSVKSAAENKNGVSDVGFNKTNCSHFLDSYTKHKTNSFLRPSTLLGGSNVLHGVNNSDSQAVESPSATKCPLKSPKLNLAYSKFGNTDESPSTGLGSKLPFQQSTNPFTNTKGCDNEKNESTTSSRNVLKAEVNASDATPVEKLGKPTFSNFTNTKDGSRNINPSILVPNFVFGQNLHERVVDGVATTPTTEASNTESANGNGTSDMLFTSVLTSKDTSKENLNDLSVNTREPFSLIEDAARCQEARANKRKYEEVLVTTGEEDEENILQVSVKLFAFDSGSWVERGRGILRLNDKNSDGVVVSRIVIRTLGSLRVVLNTKIWSGMSLSRASERSIRLTAMDPNGQVKIFLIQASPKDMGTLYRFLDVRVKRCQDNQGGPEKKKIEKLQDDDETGQKGKT